MIKKLEHLKDSSPVSQGSVLEDPNPPQFILLREEWVSLTGDLVRACVLEKMVTWSRQVPDFDLYLKEEQLDQSASGSAPKHGWFYKSNQELLEGTMLRVTADTFRRYLHFLIDRGWIQRDIITQSKWSRRSFYRVNLRKLHSDLQKKGYTFPDFTLYERFSDGLRGPSNLNTYRRDL